jgi:hypothetical protein
MNTPLPNCSTAGASRDSAQAARRARTGVHSCGTTPTPAKRLARSNSDGRTDGRRRFPPLRSLIILCGAKAKAPCAPRRGQLPPCAYKTAQRFFKVRRWDRYAKEGRQAATRTFQRYHVSTALHWMASPHTSPRKPAKTSSLCVTSKATVVYQAFVTASCKSPAVRHLRALYALPECEASPLPSFQCRRRSSSRVRHGRH